MCEKEKEKKHKNSQWKILRQKLKSSWTRLFAYGRVSSHSTLLVASVSFIRRKFITGSLLLSPCCVLRLLFFFQKKKIKLHKTKSI
jgi:hypothetical protein